MVTKPPGESYKSELSPMTEHERLLARDLRAHVDVRWRATSASETSASPTR